MNELIEILTTNQGKLDSWILKNKIDAYRVYDRELQQFPAAIDIYLKKAHIQIYEDDSTAKEDLALSSHKEKVEELFEHNYENHGNKNRTPMFTFPMNRFSSDKKISNLQISIWKSLALSEVVNM